MMKETLSLKFVPERAEKKQLCLAVIFSGCTANMQKTETGKLKCCLIMKPVSAVSKRLLQWYTAKGHTVL